MLIVPNALLAFYFSDSLWSRDCGQGLPVYDFTLIFRILYLDFLNLNSTHLMAIPLANRDFDRSISTPPFILYPSFSLFCKSVCYLLS